MTVTVRNTGTAELTNLDACVDGTDRLDFYVGFYPPPLLAPNDTAQFQIWFSPFGAGDRTADLHITSNDPDTSSFNIRLDAFSYEQGKSDGNGGIDAGLNGSVYSTVMQPNGKILLGGTFTTIQPFGTPAPVARGRIARLNADGTLDEAFNPTASALVDAIAVQNDGKILIGGSFTTLQPNGAASPVTRSRLARLNEDGSIDPSFNAAGTATHVNSTVMCILPLPNGKIMIGGGFTQINGVAQNRVARLNSDGSLDPTFNPQVSGGVVFTMLVDTQERIVLGGTFSTVGGEPRAGIARVENVAGALDHSFSPAAVGGSVYALALERGESILVGGNFTSLSGVGGPSGRNLARVKNNNSIDPTFKPNPGGTTGRVQGISVQSNGRILISGAFTEIQPETPTGNEPVTTRNRIARLHPVSGFADLDFNPNVQGTTGSQSQVYGATIQADGQVVIGGDFTTVGGLPRIGTARLSSDTVTDILAVTSPNSIEWQRGDGSAETFEVTFDVSSDGGVTWTSLGAGGRDLIFNGHVYMNGWRKSSISLPPTGSIRARARTTSGMQNGSSGIVETIKSFGEFPNIAVFQSATPLTSPHTHDFGVVQAGTSAASVVFTIRNGGGGTLSRLRNVSIDGADSSNYEVVRPAISTLAPSENVPFTVTYRPKTAAAHNLATLYIISNDPDQPVFQIKLKGAGGQPQTTWRALHFNGETANTGDAADTANPAKDGISNLEKYALGLDPAKPCVDGTGVTSPSSGGGGGFAPAARGFSDAAPSATTFLFTYTRNKLALADIIFQVEWSDTLSPNDWHTTDVTEQVTSDNGSLQQVQATVPAGTGSQRFAHLKMTQR